MKTSRRAFIKASAAASAAAAAGVPLPAHTTNLITDSVHTRLKWSKAPCRFCGTGCSVNVATKDGRVVATHGDILSEVNRGLNCVKGYFLPKIMYGADRLTKPLVRRRKDGPLEPVSWNEALDFVAENFRTVLADKGPNAFAGLSSARCTTEENYVFQKFFRQRIGTNNIDHCARY